MEFPHSYRAFGRLLASEVPLPDLPRRRTEQQADWALRIGSGPGPERLRLLAEQRIGVHALSVWKTSSGSLLSFPPVGAFEVSSDGRVITWLPAPSPAIELVRSAVVGPVLSLALHAQGIPCLHGCAVRIGREGVAFIAPKRYGKSTLTTALVEGGAQLITDDTLAVDLGGAPRLLPGVHSVKLWRDSFQNVAPTLPRDLVEGSKHTLRRFPANARRGRATPLNAVYVLSPVPPAAGRTVQRGRLSMRDAALSLVANAKIGTLLDPASSGLLLTAATRIAAQVPVYELQVPRDWDLLPEVVATLNRWHGASVPQAVVERI